MRACVAKVIDPRIAIMITSHLNDMLFSCALSALCLWST